MLACVRISGLVVLECWGNDLGSGDERGEVEDGWVNRE